MSTDRPFLDDILSNPDDDAVRLIYADWLDDQGAPARAEFIRTQIELERLTADPDADSQRVATLRAREHRLLAAHYQTWTPAVICEHAREWVYRRGFVDDVTFWPEVLIPQRGTVSGSCPFRCLCLTGSGRAAGLGQPLAGWPRLAGIRSLWFAGSAGGGPFSGNLADNFVPLIRSPFLTSLRSLRIPGFVEWAVIEALTAGACAGLEELFTGAHITDETLNLLASGQLPHLRRLSLWGDSLIEGAVRRLLLTPTGQRLTELTVGALLTSNQLPDNYREGFEYSSLRSLRLWHCPALLEEFLSSEPTGLLTRLDLSGTDLHGRRVRELAMSPWLPPLVELDLRHTGLDNEDLRFLLQAGQLQSIRRLVLDRNPRIGERGVREIAASPNLHRLTTLSLDEAGVTLLALRELVRSPMAAHLRELRLPLEDDIDACIRVLASANLPALNTLQIGIAHDRREDLLHAVTDAPGLPNLTTVLTSGFSWRTPGAPVNSGIVCTDHPDSFPTPGCVPAYGHRIP